MIGVENSHNSLYRTFLTSTSYQLPCMNWRSWIAILNFQVDIQCLLCALSAPVDTQGEEFNVKWYCILWRSRFVGLDIALPYTAIAVCFIGAIHYCNPQFRLRISFIVQEMEFWVAQACRFIWQLNGIATDSPESALFSGPFDRASESVQGYFLNPTESIGVINTPHVLRCRHA